MMIPTISTPLLALIALTLGNRVSALSPPSTDVLSPTANGLSYTVEANTCYTRTSGNQVGVYKTDFTEQQCAEFCSTSEPGGAAYAVYEYYQQQNSIYGVCDCFDTLNRNEMNAVTSTTCTADTQHKIFDRATSPYKYTGHCVSIGSLQGLYKNYQSDPNYVNTGLTLPQCFSYCSSYPHDNNIQTKYAVWESTQGGSLPVCQCFSYIKSATDITDGTQNTCVGDGEKQVYSLDGSFSLTTSIPSGAATVDKRKREAEKQIAMMRENPFCPKGKTACNSDESGRSWECIDTANELESCGGCMFGAFQGILTARGGVAFPASSVLKTRKGPIGQDCTTIGNTTLSGASCSDGECVVTQCKRGFRPLNRECVRVAGAVTAKRLASRR